MTIQEQLAEQERKADDLADRLRERTPHDFEQNKSDRLEASKDLYRIRAMMKKTIRDYEEERKAMNNVVTEVQIAVTVISELREFIPKERLVQFHKSVAAIKTAAENARQRQ